MIYEKSDKMQLMSIIIERLKNYSYIVPTLKYFVLLEFNLKKKIQKNEKKFIFIEYNIDKCKLINMERICKYERIKRGIL